MRASIHLFVKQGIDGTTTKDIAKKAGVAEGALYRHFKSKEDLAWSLFHTHLTQFTNELMGKVLKQENARDRIQTLVHESFSAYESDPELFTYLILREHTELKKYAGDLEHPGHVALRIVRDGQKSKEIRSGNPYVLGSMIVGSLIRLCVVRMYGNVQQDLRRQTTAVTAMLWTMLRTPSTKETHHA